MPKKGLRYTIFNAILLADSDYFGGYVDTSNMEHDEQYFDYLAKEIAKTLKKENFV